MNDQSHLVTRQMRKNKTISGVFHDTWKLYTLSSRHTSRFNRSCTFNEPSTLSGLLLSRARRKDKENICWRAVTWSNIARNHAYKEMHEFLLQHYVLLLLLTQRLSDVMIVDDNCFSSKQSISLGILCCLQSGSNSHHCVELFKCTLPALHTLRQRERERETQVARNIWKVVTM